MAFGFGVACEGLEELLFDNLCVDTVVFVLAFLSISSNVVMMLEYSWDVNAKY